MSQEDSAQQLTTPAQRLRATRERRGLTQAKMAALMGVTRPMIAQWETNFRHPSIATLQRLAEILDVSYEWLAFGDDVLSGSNYKANPEFMFDPEILELATDVVREVFIKKGRSPEGIGFYRMIAVMYAVAFEQRSENTALSLNGLRESLAESVQRRIGA